MKQVIFLFIGKAKDLKKKLAQTNKLTSQKLN